MLFMTSCRHATELMSQQLDRKLSFTEKLKLHTHLLICKSCTKTLQKFDILREASQRYAKNKTETADTDTSLSPDSRQRILNKLQSQQADEQKE